MNKTIKRLLRTTLGLDATPPVDRRADFEDLFGTWTEAEAEQFRERVRAFAQIDEEDW